VRLAEYSGGTAKYPPMKKCQSIWCLIWARALCSVMIFSLCLVVDTGASPQGYLPRSKCVQVTITSSHSQRERAGVKIIAEAATSAAERHKGLMYRTQLPPGMLFLFNAPQIVSMWMKNTPKSLDILFISSKNKVINIERGTVPFSLEAVSSKAPAIAALEMPAGTTKSFEPGDTVKWTPHFFPCPQK